MFLISLLFRKLKRTKSTEDKGVFYLTLSEKCIEEDGSTTWKRNNINTGFKSSDGVLTEGIRIEINRMVRMLYSIIEKLDATGEPYGRKDVITKFNLALHNDASMQDIIKKAKTNFPLRSDLVNVGNELKRDFEKIYTVSPLEEIESDELDKFLQKKIIDFKNVGQLATARSYTSTASSLRKFAGGRPVRLSQINRLFLEEYSNWLKGNGVSDSTQSFYLRTLRSALNYATEEIGLSFEENLFEGLNTKIYKAVKEKGETEINRELIREISTLNLKSDKETDLVRDMFMFGFYCQGLELSDILNLKKDNFIDGKLIFSRRKKGRTIEIQLDKLAIDILDKYKESTKEYLFPIMEIYQGFFYHSIFERVRKSMNKIKAMVKCQSLSFSSNITAWERIVSHIDMSALLLGKLG